MLLTGCGVGGAAPVAAPTAASQFTVANSEFLSIADNASLSFGDEDFSIAGWVYMDSSSGYRMPFGKWDWQNNKREYGIYDVNGTRKFGFFVDNTGSSQTNVTSATAVSLSTWAFVVGVHDSVNNLLKISINGAAFETTAYSSGCNNNTSPFLIGASGTIASPQELFDGRICKVGVWRKAISLSEVTSLYNSGNGLAHCQLSGSLLTSLEAYWNLSESSGTRADSSGNGNNLNDNNTVTGNPGIGSGNCL